MQIIVWELGNFVLTKERTSDTFKMITFDNSAYK